FLRARSPVPPKITRSKGSTGMTRETMAPPQDYVSANEYRPAPSSALGGASLASWRKRGNDVSAGAAGVGRWPGASGIRPVRRNPCRVAKAPAFAMAAPSPLVQCLPMHPQQARLRRQMLHRLFQRDLGHALGGDGGGKVDRSALRRMGHADLGKMQPAKA